VLWTASQLTGQRLERPALSKCFPALVEGIAVDVAHRVTSLDRNVFRSDAHVIRRDLPKHTVSSSPLAAMLYNFDMLRPLTALPSLNVAQPAIGYPSGARTRPFSSRLMSVSAIVSTPAVIVENQDYV
jgi:hypothetical protein